MLIDGVQITGITCDIDRVKPGYGYVIIDKQVSNVIDCAVEQGASIIFTEDVNLQIKDKKICIKYVKDAKKQFMDLYYALYGNPFDKIEVIGVIGVHGKTTTMKMLYHLLQWQGIGVGYIGNGEVNINSSIQKISAKMGLHDILDYLNGMIEQHVQIAIIEMDQSMLEVGCVSILSMDVIIHTNLESSYEINDMNFQYDLYKQQAVLQNLSKRGIIILNADDKNNIKLVEGMENALIITYGLSSKATITASSINIVPSIKFNCCIQRGMTSKNEIDIEPMEFPVQIHLIGRHNVYNTLAAISTALVYDVTPENITKALKEFNHIKRRMNIIYDKKYKIVDNMCSRPLHYEVAFETIQNMNYKKLYIIHAIAGNKGAEVNKSNALSICAWMKGIRAIDIITTCSIDTVEEGDRVSKREKESFHQVFIEHKLPYEHRCRLKDAIEMVLNSAQENDLILLLGENGMNKGEKLVRQFFEKEKI